MLRFYVGGYSFERLSNVGCVATLIFNGLFLEA